MTRAWLSIALLAACAAPQQQQPSAVYQGDGTSNGADNDQASAICQHLNRCGLADDVAACTAEFAAYDPDRTRSLLDRNCDALSEMKAGNAPGGGGGGGCAVDGTNDCGMGMMCCAGRGGAASPGVPGSCVSVATCTGPRR